jgi:hypothetical protein
MVKSRLVKHEPDGITYSKPDIYRCKNCGERYSIETREELNCKGKKNE